MDEELLLLGHGVVLVEGLLVLGHGVVLDDGVLVDGHGVFLDRVLVVEHGVVEGLVVCTVPVLEEGVDAAVEDPPMLPRIEATAPSRALEKPKVASVDVLKATTASARCASTLVRFIVLLRKWELVERTSELPKANCEVSLALAAGWAARGELQRQQRPTPHDRRRQWTPSASAGEEE